MTFTSRKGTVKCSGLFALAFLNKSSMLHLSTHPILEVELSLVSLHGIFLGFYILNLGGTFPIKIKLDE